MIIETDSELYQTIRSNFVDLMYSKHYSYFHHGEKFSKLLYESGGKLSSKWISLDTLCACDSLGIIIGIEYIEFENDEDYVGFVLKWS